MNRKLGIVQATDAALESFDDMLLVFRNCVVLAVDDSLSNQQVKRYKVETNFLPEVEPGEIIPEYEVIIEADESIRLVVFRSTSGERFTAYSR